MGARREGRVAAVQMLYQLDCWGVLVPGGEWRAADVPPFEDLVADHFDTFGAPQDPSVAEFAAELCKGVVEHGEVIDELIERSSHNWRLSRMSRVDRNVLRVAVFELRFRPAVPDRVVINEAIEIAKQYGSTESGAFINGILDQLSRRKPAAPS